MTDAEREVLVERMLQPMMDVVDDYVWEEERDRAREAMRAALAEAERVVREDEREACLAIVAAWSRDGQSPTAHGIDEGIRARGDA